jgi:adenylate cyclase
VRLAQGQKEMLSAYRAKDWDGAERALESIAGIAQRFALEKLVAVYRERIATYRISPPPANWDGVYQALTK